VQAVLAEVPEGGLEMGLVRVIDARELDEVLVDVDLWLALLDLFVRRSRVSYAKEGDKLKSKEKFKLFKQP